MTRTPSLPSRAVCWGVVYAASAVPLVAGTAARLAGNARARSGQPRSAIARGGKPDSFDFSHLDSPIDTVAVHPHDDKVLLGGVGVRKFLPEGGRRGGLARAGWPTTTCGTTCRTSRSGSSTGPGPTRTLHLDFVLTDAARAVERLRDEGRTVLLNCVAPTAAPDGSAALRRPATGHQHRTGTARCPVRAPLSSEPRRSGLR